MPSIVGSSFTTVGAIVQAARAIINDSQIAGGDILTDTYSGTIPLVNIAYRNVQKELAAVGVQTFLDYCWLLAIPPVPQPDPECRVLVTDTGTQITYPNLAVFNPVPSPLNFNTPRLPSDLIVPLKLWERPNGTTLFPVPMNQPNDGNLTLAQQTYLIDWEWASYQSGDALIFRGALQAQDVKVKYEKALPNVAIVSDPVPIRGVDNAAAYQVAKAFSSGRGSEVSPQFLAEAREEIYLLQAIAVRRSQRKRSRRQPYSGMGSSYNWPRPY